MHASFLDYYCAKGLLLIIEKSVDLSNAINYQLIDFYQFRRKVPYGI